jgi:hypothetical protein
MNAPSAVDHLGGARADLRPPRPGQALPVQQNPAALAKHDPQGLLWPGSRRFQPAEFARQRRGASIQSP